jgi:hypothetical protein
VLGVERTGLRLRHHAAEAGRPVTLSILLDGILYRSGFPFPLPGMLPAGGPLVTYHVDKSGRDPVVGLRCAEDDCLLLFPPCPRCAMKGLPIATNPSNMHDFSTHLREVSRLRGISPPPEGFQIWLI